MREHVKIMFREEEVNRRIQEVAGRINRDYGDTPLHLICILEGGATFACELAKRLTMPASLDFTSVSSYNGTESSGVVQIARDLDELPGNKHILVVEDTIDTGRTLAYLIKVLKRRGSKDTRPCTLLGKPECCVKKQVTVDYVYFTIPDHFVVGYDFDYDRKYRSYPYVNVVGSEDDKV